MIASRRSLRLIAQFASLATAAVVLWPLTPWSPAPRFVSQTSPFLAICTAIATRAVGLGSILGFAIALVTVARRRLFCRYLCPTGLLLEGITRIGLGKTSWWARWPPIGKYAAILTAAGALVGYPVLLWMEPIAVFSTPFAIRGAADFFSGAVAGLCLVVLILATCLMGLVVRESLPSGSRSGLAGVREIVVRGTVREFESPNESAFNAGW